MSSRTALTRHLGMKTTFRPNITNLISYCSLCYYEKCFFYNIYDYAFFVLKLAALLYVCILFNHSVKLLNLQNKDSKIFSFLCYVKNAVFTPYMPY